MKKDKKKTIIYTTIIITGILLIGIGVKKSLKVKNNIKYRSVSTITNIKVSDTHYIDKSLINVPINVPYTTNSNSENKNNVTIISDNPDIIKVNDDNTITALKIGEANLTLIAKENEEITAGLHIIVE